MYAYCLKIFIYYVLCFHFELYQTLEEYQISIGYQYSDRGRKNMYIPGFCNMEDKSLNMINKGISSVLLCSKERSILPTYSWELKKFNYEKIKQLIHSNIKIKIISKDIKSQELNNSPVIITFFFSWAASQIDINSHICSMDGGSNSSTGIKWHSNSLLADSGRHPSSVSVTITPTFSLLED